MLCLRNSTVVDPRFQTRRAMAQLVDKRYFSYISMFNWYMKMNIFVRFFYWNLWKKFWNVPLNSEDFEFVHVHNFGILVNQNHM